MDKGGQFYLIVAVILIAIILSFAVVANRSQIRESNIFKNLGEELEIESESVLDYGLHQEYSDNELSFLMRNFTEYYSAYTQIENSYYVFGDNTNVSVAGYRRYSDYGLLVNSDLGQSTIDLPIEDYVYNYYENPGNYISLIIKDTTYNLTLGTGKSFYFILSQEIGEEDYVITNF